MTEYIHSYLETRCFACMHSVERCDKCIDVLQPGCSIYCAEHDGHLCVNCYKKGESKDGE
jgi:hypothetical protein